jgi:hypothetical protein
MPQIAALLFGRNGIHPYMYHKAFEGFGRSVDANLRFAQM